MTTRFVNNKDDDVAKRAALLICFQKYRGMRGAEGTTWDGIPSESPPQAGICLSFTITKMGWESLSLMMVMRWNGKHEEMH